MAKVFVPRVAKLLQKIIATVGTATEKTQLPKT